MPEIKLREMENRTIRDKETGEERANITWINFVQSIRNKGILNPVSVILNDDGTYTLVDGLRRYSF